jgi:hypothetical protein
MTDQSNDNQSTPNRKLSSTDAPGISETDRFFHLLRHKTTDLINSGFREGHARRLADLDMRIAQWPSGWGDDLVVLIYGDFIAPPAELDFPQLGITVEPERVPDSFIKSATCVLKARVKISEKSVKAIFDAATRINTLLGVLAVLNWGNSGCGWSSHVTHDSGGALMQTLEPDRVQKVIKAIGTLPLPVALKVRSAMYWIREPRNSLMEGYRSDALRMYAGYWNAFECLVEAVCLLRPQPKPMKSEKQTGIDAFIAKRKGKLDAAAISECYRTFVDPGFVAKASHVLKVCFPERADHYIAECFRIKPEEDRLYNIRNAINHGDVDADNLSELLRIEDRYLRLWMIVFGILGLIIPTDRPLDQP